ncbi:MAG: tRNA (adenosine(37)-N6)-dimethylallyltransferase MiaA [Parcubacteria group bacterium]|nr:tRNA (adenosine(37)-N6)-dimethylallyltransferase MiaA [Parcubacteria group bacterium]
MNKFLNSLKNFNNKLLVIIGPTASGKSDLAIEIAKKFNGEIISADSRQVYKGMDIGTGKVKIQKVKGKIYSEGIRHHLLDVAEPKEYFSVAQYQKLALEAIEDIQKRKKLPILCGGTGLYINAVIEGWQLPPTQPNLKLRQELEQFSPAQLFEKLKSLDPKRTQNIDAHNKRRLIRALEIIAQNKTISPLKKVKPPWDILILGIKKDKNELQELIKKRLLKRLDEGMIEEVKKLKEKGVSSQRLEDFGLEYRWINRYLENKVMYEEMINSLYRDICRFAKRQMTWFIHQIFAKQNLDGSKNKKNTFWIKNTEEAIKLTTHFLAN